MTRLKPLKLKQLEDVLIQLGPGAVAVSGGVDSLTLAEVLNRVFGEVNVFHAISPAVPAAATGRVRHYAEELGWDLQEVDAREFKDENYLKNPLNRCYYCKTNLYQTIRAKWNGNIFSGTNADDLSDFRPGLIAATENAVIHPYVLANTSKSELRDISAFMGLDLVAALPASPCLSSRITTGVVVNSTDLEIIESIENWLHGRFELENARCRRSERGFYLQLDGQLVNKLSEDETSAIIQEAAFLHPSITITHLEPYRQGSSFIKVESNER